MRAHGMRADYYGPDNPADYVDPSQISGTPFTNEFSAIQSPKPSQDWNCEQCYDAENGDEEGGRERHPHDGRDRGDFMPPGDYSYTCDQCSKPCRDERALQKHQRSHSKRYVCQASSGCGYKFTDKKDLERHYRGSHPRYAEKLGLKDGETKCDKCGKSFTRKDNMLKHRQKCNG
ncbi:uncharacterized protein F5Z01DRAFT_633138 [Emericellopsis atlantica]|uniref:C2H2-type domain-containing protein n=1 Tax=Emericellopsis atlantica TaxID=2614577 RepID=A0A9P7ZUQ1_9HYPO|nr:uncharacterized protein F5Z01DRAFT_633138 [Emericellopsis atlantica]KAG9258141.1 hypothetical protein F5Z01DRAFT_633138 [Emericellopsis atlantica]